MLPTLRVIPKPLWTRTPRRFSPIHVSQVLIGLPTILLLSLICLFSHLLELGHIFSFRVCPCVVSILLLLNITPQVQWSPVLEGLLFELKEIFFKDAVSFIQIILKSETEYWPLSAQGLCVSCESLVCNSDIQTSFYVMNAHFKIIFRYKYICSYK